MQCRCKVTVSVVTTAVSGVITEYISIRLVCCLGGNDTWCFIALTTTIYGPQQQMDKGQTKS